uniref:D4, zinc and double PHD fingers family 2 n=1 Tax=Xenopus tropicalis TaxID=8364 RepID=Q6DJ77_XENTR
MTTYFSTNYHKNRSSHLSEQYYREVMDSTSNYNVRLCSERRQRLPFLDSQTGVAQNHSNLWVPYTYRRPGKCHGQLYSYPARRWKKKCSLPLPDIPLGPLTRIKPAELEAIESDVHQISTVENPSIVADNDSKDLPYEEVSYREEYYNEWENLSEPPDAGEIDRRNSDSSDFEETYIKKKGKKKEKKVGLPKELVNKNSQRTIASSKTTPSTNRGRSKKEKEMEILSDKDKPYACDLCGARYKTRPGLTYHMAHSHNKQPPDEEIELPQPSPKIVVPPPPFETTTTSSGSTLAIIKKPPSTSSSSKSGSKYCDFCLGDELENKKTGSKEEMVSCADCGRSGHPSCLQFSPNMIISVKKYPWQCIECKSCGLCGTSDNDDQLLFCDDCDRGYHMYCLKPPLSEPPEGSWSCHLCIVEFYDGRKPDTMVE